MTSLAARTRDAVRERPFLHDGLRAGVINYTAAARYLDVEGDVEAVATALRRYADELAAGPPVGADARVSMESGVGRVGSEGDGGDGGDGDSDGEDVPLLSVSGEAFASNAGSLTAILTVGDVDPGLLSRVLARLEIVDVEIEAAGMAGDSLVVVVGRRAGVNALRAVESIVEA